MKAAHLGVWRMCMSVRACVCVFVCVGVVVYSECFQKYSKLESSRSIWIFYNALIVRNWCLTIFFFWHLVTLWLVVILSKWNRTLNTCIKEFTRSCCTCWSPRVSPLQGGWGCGGPSGSSCQERSCSEGRRCRCCYLLDKDESIQMPNKPSWNSAQGLKTS